MRAVFLALWLVAPGVLYAQGASSAPKDTAAAKQPDPPAPPVNHLETTIAGFKLTGFAEGSYAYSGHSLGDTALVGRLYDRLQNRFTLNALAAVTAHAIDRDAGDAGPEERGLHLRQPLGADHRGDQFHLASSSEVGAQHAAPLRLDRFRLRLELPRPQRHGGGLA